MKTLLLAMAVGALATLTGCLAGGALAQPVPAPLASAEECV